MTPTRAEVRAWLRQCVEQYGALIGARDTDPDDVTGWQKEEACAHAALAALDDAERMDRLDEIQDGWVSFRRHLDAWLLESSRYHGRGATIPEAIDRVELRPQLQGRHEQT